VQFMGRENLDDYQASFLVLLETWEAAERHLAPDVNGAEVQPIEIAALVGWTVERKQTVKAGDRQLADVGRACNAAHKSIVVVVCLTCTPRPHSCRVSTARN
jgi:hypothetical protein